MPYLHKQNGCIIYVGHFGEEGKIEIAASPIRRRTPIRLLVHCFESWFRPEEEIPSPIGDFSEGIVLNRSETLRLVAYSIQVASVALGCGPLSVTPRLRVADLGQQGHGN